MTAGRRCQATVGSGMGLLLVLNGGATGYVEVDLGARRPGVVWVVRDHVVGSGRSLIEGGCDVYGGVLDGPLFGLEAVEGLVALEACVADEGSLVLGV